MKPMKSADLAKYDNDLSKLRYPLIAQPKLDGLRCIINHGVALSNNLEPFRNKFLQAWAKGWDNMDGELIVGPATGGNVLGRTQSGIMAFEGEPDFTFHWFDRPRTERGENYTQRLRSLKEPREPRVLVVDHQWCHDSTELSLYESECVAEGYEGVMTRDPEGPYKYGRSTLKEGWLVKIKRFTDGEAKVVGVEEAEQNTNEATTDNLGRTKRSAAQAGKVGKGMVGTIIAHDKKWGELRLAPGTMNHAERALYWADQGALLGRTVHWRCFGYGLKDKPRFARFYGFRPN